MFAPESLLHPRRIKTIILSKTGKQEKKKAGGHNTERLQYKMYCNPRVVWVSCLFLHLSCGFQIGRDGKIQLPLLSYYGNLFASIHKTLFFFHADSRRTDTAIKICWRTISLMFKTNLEIFMQVHAGRTDCGTIRCNSNLPKQKQRYVACSKMCCCCFFVLLHSRKIKTFTLSETEKKNHATPRPNECCVQKARQSRGIGAAVFVY